MLDPKLLRNDIQTVAELLKRRGFSLDTNNYIELENARKEIQTEVERLRNERNVKSKEIGIAKSKGKDVTDLFKNVEGLGAELKKKEEELREVQKGQEKLFMLIPNILHESVPDGLDESANKEIRHWGEPRKFNFTVRDHVDLGAVDGRMDFESAAKISGARFVVLKGLLAKLHRALIQFMLDLHTREHGYEEIYVPYLVNSDSMHGTGQLSKFKADVFAATNPLLFDALPILTEKDKFYGNTGVIDNPAVLFQEYRNPLYLIPTAEVPITNLARNLIYDDKALPKCYVAHTPCFRSEAGSAGKDVRGMIRQHQFEKVELVQLVKPQDSYDALEKLTGHAETVLQKLGLPYRVMALCGGDIGFSAAKTYDLEVWLPSQNRYREISSCSNCTDFQARRMLARWRNPATGKPELLHTLNGSGVAVGRALIAIMENCQDKNGHIHVPPVLHAYMSGVTVI